MAQDLEKEISELLTKQKCSFCRQEVKKLNLAGLEHEKEQPFLLKKPICKSCWEKKPSLNDKSFSSLEKIQKTNQKLWNWINNHKEKQSKS